MKIKQRSTGMWGVMKNTIKPLKIREKNKISFYILSIFFLEKCLKINAQEL